MMGLPLPMVYHLPSQTSTSCPALLLLVAEIVMVNQSRTALSVYHRKHHDRYNPVDLFTEWQSSGGYEPVFSMSPASPGKELQGGQEGNSQQMANACHAGRE